VKVKDLRPGQVEELQLSYMSEGKLRFSHIHIYVVTDLTHANIFIDEHNRAILKDKR